MAGKKRYRTRAGRKEPDDRPAGGTEARKPSRPGPAGDHAADPPAGGERRAVAGWRKWMFRLAAMTVVPALVITIVEMGLRWGGYGYPPGFFVSNRNSETYTTNLQFGRRFFPRELVRTPVVCELADPKPERTYRIFVLGGSAAMGTPEPDFGLPRMLRAVLRQRYPGHRFEVVNAAMTAINSHVALPIARDCARFEPDLFVVYMGNNEVVGPYGSGTVLGRYSPSLLLIRASIAAQTTRIGQLFQSVMGRDDGPGTWKGMEMFLENRVAADDSRMASVYQNFRRNLEGICQVATGCGARTIVCTVPVNLKDCPPFASVHRAGLGDEALQRWSDCVAAAAAAENSGDLQAAEGEYRKALGMDDGYAELHYLLGCCLMRQGRAGEARDHLVAARDLDALRFRADSRINETIRGVAGSGGGVGKALLVDAEKVFADPGGEDGGLPGATDFYEHVHLTPEGNFRVAEAIADVMAGEILPAEVTAAERAGPAATLARSCELLALTPWDRRRMMKAMLELQDRPPFAGRLWQERVNRARRSIEEADPVGGDAGMMAEAEKGCRQVLAEDREDLLVRARLAGLLRDRKRFDESIEIWRDLVGRFPGMVEWRGRFMSALLHGGREAEVGEQFRMAVDADPVAAEDLRFNLATDYLMVGKTKLAEEQFQQILALHPEDLAALNSLGVALFQEGRHGEATGRFARALEISPDYQKARINMAKVLIRQGRKDQAMETLKQAVSLDPTGLAAYWLMAKIHSDTGDREQAVAVHREAASACPDSAEASYRLGVVLERYDHLAEAIEAYRTAWQLDPGHGRAGHNLGAALFKAGRQGEAVAQYRENLKAHPGFRATVINLSQALVTTREPDLRDEAEAVRMIEAACKETGYQDIECLNALAFVYAEAGRLEDAVAVIGRGIHLARAAKADDVLATLEQSLAGYKRRIVQRDSNPQPPERR